MWWHQHCGYPAILEVRGYEHPSNVSFLVTTTTHPTLSLSCLLWTRLKWAFRTFSPFLLLWTASSCRRNGLCCNQRDGFSAPHKEWRTHVLSMAPNSLPTKQTNKSTLGKGIWEKSKVVDGRGDPKEWSHSFSEGGRKGRGSSGKNGLWTKTRGPRGPGHTPPPGIWQTEWTEKEASMVGRWMWERPEHKDDKEVNLGRDQQTSYCLTLFFSKH